MDVSAIETMGVQFWGSGLPHKAYDITVTPDMASTVLQGVNYERQRHHLPRHSAYLAEAIARDEFSKYSDIHFVVRDGIVRLVNGQHRLHAVVKAGKPVLFCVHFQRATTNEEVEAMYSKFDVGRRRSLSDSLGSSCEIAGLSKKEAEAFGVAVKKIRMGFSTDMKNAPMDAVFEVSNYESVKQMMRDWEYEAEKYFEAVRTVNRALFLRSPVIAVGLLTFRHQPEKALEFWTETASDDGLRIGDPRKALVNWLRQHNSQNAPTWQHRATIACWNAFFEDRVYRSVRTRSEASLRIAGTDIRVGADFRDRVRAGEEGEVEAPLRRKPRSRPDTRECRVSA
jgi:hypothetical protein